MKIKIKRQEYEITVNDKFLDNGACVQLLTQNKNKMLSWSRPSPVLSNKLAKKIRSLVLVNLPTKWGIGVTEFYISQESLDKYKEL